MPVDQSFEAPALTAAPPRPDALVGAKDEDFRPHTWEEVKGIIAVDRLDLLDRWPSDARRYVEWADGVRAEYGSVINFICKERLGWERAPEEEEGRPRDSIFAYASPIPFADATDYKVLRNDWPYRWEKGISHVCVWMKNRLPADRETGRITAEGRRMVEAFVRRTFMASLPGGEEEGADRVLWYKNWSVLQSISAIEHFHVLVRDVGEETILRWTGFDTTIHDT